MYGALCDLLQLTDLERCDQGLGLPATRYILVAQDDVRDALTRRVYISGTAETFLERSERRCHKGEVLRLYDGVRRWVDGKVLAASSQDLSLRADFRTALTSVVALSCGNPSDRQVPAQSRTTGSCCM